MAENLKTYLLDILSVLLPGGLLVALLARFESFLYSYASLFPTDGNNWVAVLVFAGVAYMFGHFIFLFGSWLDDLLFEPCQKVFWKDPLLKSIVIQYKEEKTGITDRRALNAFKWSCAWLLKNEPAMHTVVERHIAESKFFRSLVVVLLAGVVIFLVTGGPGKALAAFILVFFSMVRYITQRVKAIETAYQFVITASGIRFHTSQSSAIYARLLEQRVWVKETGNRTGDFFRKLGMLARLVFRKGAARPGNCRTLEVRWFFPQPDPVIETFFQSQGKPLSSAATRTDRYLVIPGKEDISIKLREGKMEIKKRTGTPLAVHFHPQCAGYLEDWEKSAFRLMEEKMPGNATGYWLPVKKERTGITWSKNEQGEWATHDIKNRPAAGCQAEYTRLTINGGISYTFGLEWFGNQGERSLPPALDGLFGQLQLSADISCGYNVYLNKMAMKDTLPPADS